MSSVETAPGESKPPLLESAGTRTRTAEVVDILRAAIIDGRLAPGRSLLETELASQIQVSRSPIREALRQLAEEGLVVSTPYKGAHVSDMSVEHLEEVYSFRAVLEGTAARWIVQARDSIAWEPLDDSMRAISTAAETGDHRAAVEADLAFHQALCSLPGHSLLLAAWQTTVSHVLRAINFFAYRGDLHSVPADHETIVKALKFGDERTAADSIERHIRASAEEMIARVQSRQQGLDG